ncbi:hypothetical protein GF325_11605 [Candidatus Bathyarchaeota archaeon]|nr:hypothetical protein [Candidatus Bathyarchaeota archaeon]
MMHVAFDSNMFIALEQKNDFNALNIAKRALGDEARFLLLESVEEELRNSSLAGKAKASCGDYLSISPNERESPLYQAIYSISEQHHAIKSSHGKKAKYHADHDLVFWFMKVLLASMGAPSLNLKIPDAWKEESNHGDIDIYCQNVQKGDTFLVITDDVGIRDTIKYFCKHHEISLPDAGVVQEPFTFLMGRVNSEYISSPERDDLLIGITHVLEHFIMYKKERKEEIAEFCREIMRVSAKALKDSTKRGARVNHRIIQRMQEHVTGVKDITIHETLIYKVVNKAIPYLDAAKNLLDSARKPRNQDFINFCLQEPILTKNLDEIAAFHVKYIGTFINTIFFTRKMNRCLLDGDLDSAIALLEHFIILKGPEIEPRSIAQYLLNLVYLHVAAENATIANELMEEITNGYESDLDGWEMEAHKYIVNLVNMDKRQETINNPSIHLGEIAKKLVDIAHDFFLLGSQQSISLLESLLRDPRFHNLIDDYTKRRVMQDLSFYYGAFTTSPPEDLPAVMGNNQDGWNYSDHTSQPFARLFDKPVDLDTFKEGRGTFTILEFQPGGSDGTSSPSMLCWLDKIFSRVVVLLPEGHEWSFLEQVESFTLEKASVSVKKYHHLSHIPGFSISYRLLISLQGVSPGDFKCKEKEFLIDIGHSSLE